jgi:hypothetical protein
MALTRRGDRCHGESQADIREELLRYSQVNGYRADHFAECKCACGGRVFQLELDDNEGAAVRHCIACSQDHPIGDSADFLDDAELEECACPCGADGLEITVGVSLYADSEDVRWVYLGCRCPACGLTAVYGDWKNEFNGYRNLLERA